MLEAWATGLFAVITAPVLIREVEDALRYERIRVRYGLSEADIRAVLALLWVEADVIDDPLPGDVLALTGDPDDDVLVAVARSAGASHVVSGDRKVRAADLGGDPLVVSAAEFAEMTTGET